MNEQVIYDLPKRVTFEEGHIVDRPSLSVNFHDADEFIRELKEAIRQYEGSTPDYFTGELKATKYHLEDLRKLLKVNR